MDNYTPTMEELKEAWIAQAGLSYAVSSVEASQQFDRLMDEFGNEQYEDGFSAGVSWMEDM